MTPWRATGTTKPFRSLVKVSASRARLHALHATLRTMKASVFSKCTCGEMFSEDDAPTNKDPSMDVDERFVTDSDRFGLPGQKGVHEI